MVFVAVCLSLLLGMAALAFDFGRVTTTQSELQSFADNVALAAAGELDGHADSIIRATNAAANVINDHQTFGIRNKDHTLSGVTDYQLRFYETPSNSDVEPGQPGELLNESDADSALKAAFVRVSVATHEVETPLAAAMASLLDQPYQFASVDAEAVAGFTLVACDITPMFFCLPQPSLEVNEGQLIKMVSQGGGSESWGPGNFGFIQVDDVLGIDEAGACENAPPGQEDACALAASRTVSQCFSKRGVETKPGLSVGNMIAGFNTRFDRYESAANQFRNDAKYDVDNFAAAPNVLDGWITTLQGGTCGNEPSPPYEVDGEIDLTATVGLPLDDCFGSTGSCPSTRIGDGDFTSGLQTYLTVNYGADYSGETPSGIPTWFPDTGTRYDIYKAETANQVDLQAILTAAGKVESSLPSCQPPSTGASNANRRVIIAAGIDCATYEDELNGGSGVVPVSKFVEMFLIRPSESDGTGANAVIYAEVIRTVESGSDNNGTGGILHDVVQLYR
ncbi:Tad domain-containing protein [Ruegeria sp. WL0004]|uniref:Tad domain-containing protein n=1 Tax=Ruegeria marisflavi TaxID=2984152 RepID=A0ABT2WWF7_9RHOB|nr:Tad domain-containing protein [Ruegeria sp. WL0004]MCU9840229.1 Tad domain-containing protein [Ruegeria sp. WL0004]